MKSKRQKNILITGGAGFIGSSLVRLTLQKGYKVIIFDKLTYAGVYTNIENLVDNNNCFFIKGDITDYDLLLRNLKDFQVEAVLNLAAESHVDNSIQESTPFIQTNILGTHKLLEASRIYFSNMSSSEKKKFRFIHVSTDEVFGELTDSDYFTETSRYAPNSPYSASKAASDHLARAWHKTYGLPVIITNCSNNYGPRQHPEKLIPRMLMNALNGKKMPLYGKGLNVRDWIHVEDHVNGLLLALEKGVVGEYYCFGGNAEKRNIDVANQICKILDQKKPLDHSKSYSELIHFVEDRPGHDWRYAINSQKAEKELGFSKKYKNFDEGLIDTIDWYLKNMDWCMQLDRNLK